jgi:hypothetical protein
MVLFGSKLLISVGNQSLNKEMEVNINFKIQSQILFIKRHLINIFLLLSLAIFFPKASNAEVKYLLNGDGVKHYWNESTDGKCKFHKNLMDFLGLERYLDIKLGKSVAFLFGCHDYESLSDLKCPQYDIEDMRSYLLSKGGFDDVYIAYGDIVTKPLVEKYILNIFKSELTSSDRLLIYYTGHGANKDGIGYLMFSNADDEDIFGNNVLKMSDVIDWFKQLPSIGHILILLDCCASGMAETPKETPQNYFKRVVCTLSGNGSRNIITAGSGNEAAFEPKEYDSLGHCNSNFTRVFIDVATTMETDANKNGIITVDQIYSVVKDEIPLRFGSNQPQPNFEKHQKSKYKGSFLFINPDAKKFGINYQKVYEGALSKKGENSVPFRCECDSLSIKDVKKMIVINNFYCKEDSTTISYSYSGEGLENIFNVHTMNDTMVVVDSASCLMWQQAGSPEKLAFENSQKRVDALNESQYAGFNDWRLPTLEEAMSLMEPEKKNGNLYIDSIFDQTQKYIWTCDLVEDKTWAWSVFFDYGFCYDGYLVLKLINSVTYYYAASVKCNSN